MIDLAHIHPMILHFPLALLPVAIAAEGIALFTGTSLFGRNCLSRSTLILLSLAGLAALAAAAFGDMALDIAVDRGFPDAKMEDHEDLGLTTAWVMIGLAAVQGFFYWKQSESRGLDILMTLVAVGVLGLLLTTAWYGGHLVYDLGVNVKVGG